MADLLRASIVFDGGSLGNPGRGYGSYRLKEGDGDWGVPVRLEYGDGITNNEAEYLSLIAAMEQASELANPRDVALEVFGDSLLVIKHLKGEWRVKAPNLAPLHLRAKQQLARFGRVSLVWHARSHSVRLLGH